MADIKHAVAGVEEEEEEKGEGTRTGLAPLTTGPGLPSNP